jgi:hypothetical protein
MEAVCFSEILYLPASPRLPYSPEDQHRQNGVCLFQCQITALSVIIVCTVYIRPLKDA